DSDFGTSQCRWGRRASSVLSGNHSAGVLSGSVISRIRVTRISPISQRSMERYPLNPNIRQQRRLQDRSGQCRQKAITLPVDWTLGIRRHGASPRSRGDDLEDPDQLVRQLQGGTAFVEVIVGVRAAEAIICGAVPPVVYGGVVAIAPAQQPCAEITRHGAQ